jgi:hypothetical protein
MSRERDIRNGIKLLLEGTGEFDEVYLGSWRERGRPATDLKGIAIEPHSGGKGTGWDDELTGGWEYPLKLWLEIAVRMDDPQVRDEEAERLLGVIQNTLNGESIAGFTLLQKTYVTDWTWIPPEAPERRIRCTFQCDYVVSGDEYYDVSP